MIHLDFIQIDLCQIKDRILMFLFTMTILSLIVIGICGKHSQKDLMTMIIKLMILRLKINNINNNNNINKIND